MLHYFSSAGYTVNKTRSSLDLNTVNVGPTRVSAGLLPLTSNFRHINNFELTVDPFKLFKLYNLRYLL